MVDGHARARRAMLVPLGPEHYDFVYGIVASPDMAWRWRYRGAVPSSEQFSASLWQGVTAQFLVVSKVPKQMAGMVTFYKFSPQGRNGFIAAVAHPSFAGTGVMVEGVLLLIDYAFRTWDLRKVYFETLEFNLLQFAGLGEMPIEEGRLRDHDEADGRSWDFVTFAIYQEDWLRHRDELLVTEELLRKRRAARSGGTSD
jgi:RimJ/RimL family protein N-acetyltransferase